MNKRALCHSAGFTMIEVLVALLLIVVGVLGMVALQSKAIPYTQDSVQRNTAIMLADDLLELIRTTQGDSTQSIKSFQKAPGAAFPATTTACVPTPTSINDRLACWAKRAATALPGASDNGGALMTNSFYVCWSTTPGDVSTSSCASGNEIEIQLAWTVKSGECLDATSTNTAICTYKVRTRL